jgi:hypothetical protein
MAEQAIKHSDFKYIIILQNTFLLPIFFNLQITDLLKNYGTNFL